MGLSGLAYDAETASANLVWDVVSQHDTQDMTIVVATASGKHAHVAQFNVSTAACKVHVVVFRVTDAAGNAREFAVTVNLLGGAGPELLTNGDMESGQSFVIYIYVWPAVPVFEIVNKHRAMCMRRRDLDLM